MKRLQMPDLSSGLCVGRLDLFEDINSLTAFAATQLCKSGCPVYRACREWGIRHEKFGCWGGLADRALTKQRKELGIRLQEPPSVPRVLAGQYTTTRSTIGDAA